MSSAIHIARGLGITAVIVTYAVLVHHVNTSDAGSILGAILALAPILLIVATFAWNTQSRLIGISTLLIACLALGIESFVYRLGSNTNFIKALFFVKKPNKVEICN